MLIRTCTLVLLLILLNSCSMPSVGYQVRVSFLGDIDKVCIEKTFKKRFVSSGQNYTNKSGTHFTVGAYSEIELKKKFMLPQNLKITNHVSWSQIEPQSLRLSSYFLSSRPSLKFLKQLKKNKDAVNYISSSTYQGLNSLVDQVVEKCRLKVTKRTVSCHSYGRSKKYFKCVEPKSAL